MNARFDPEKICRNLRCKEMFAEGDNDEYRKHQPYDHFEAAAFWCSKTQTGRGPDGKPVQLEDCSRGACRSCYLGFESLS